MHHGFKCYRFYFNVFAWLDHDFTVLRRLQVDMMTTTMLTTMLTTMMTTMMTMMMTMMITQMRRETTTIMMIWSATT